MRVICLISLAVKLASCLSLSFSLSFALFFRHISLTCLQFGADEQSCRGDLMLCSQTQRHHSASSMSLSLSHSLSCVLYLLTHSVTSSIFLSLCLWACEGVNYRFWSVRKKMLRSPRKGCCYGNGNGLFVCVYVGRDRKRIKNANLTRDSSYAHLKDLSCAFQTSLLIY